MGGCPNTPNIAILTRIHHRLMGCFRPSFPSTRKPFCRDEPYRTLLPSGVFGGLPTGDKAFFRAGDPFKVHAQRRPKVLGRSRSSSLTQGRWKTMGRHHRLWEPVETLRHNKSGTATSTCSAMNNQKVLSCLPKNSCFVLCLGH